MQRALTILLSLLALSVAAEEFDLSDLLGSPPVATLLDTNELHHIEQALDCLNMTTADLGFDKDHADHAFVLPVPMEILDRPLRLPEFGKQLLDYIQSDKSSDKLAQYFWKQFGTNAYPRTYNLGVRPKYPILNDPLQNFMGRMNTEKAAFGWEKRNLDAYVSFSVDFWTGVFDLERFSDEKPFVVSGHTSNSNKDQVERLIEESLAQADLLDPEPAALRNLAMYREIRLFEPLRWSRGVQELRAAIASFTNWPDTVQVFDKGEVVIGTMGNETYTQTARLIIDPGGDDVYRGDAGVARFGQAVIMDLGGDDQYLGNGLLGPGSAVFGRSYIYDAAGNDLYRCSHAGIACALGGTAWLEDAAGDDIYEGKAFSQAAAVGGLAVLIDHDGNDRYNLGYMGQAYAGVLGQAYLIDRKGHDYYTAGGRYIDHGHHNDRFLSMAQGFSIGMRPYAAGGIAALVDLEGNDSYKADVWGQGVSYWYALGMLIDAAGNDTYSMYHYGQGSGIHLSSGLLADLGGNDFYTGYALVQGNAHDWAVGMLLDQDGNDVYTADHFSQGRGMTNGYGMLLDRKGDDGYYVKQCDRSQGIGSDGWQREYGSIALLLDLLGKDAYTCGGADGTILRRPDHGVIYDR